MDNNQQIGLAAVGVSAVLLGMWQYKSMQTADEEKEETYHIGIETGGTSCKVAIMKDLKSLELYKSKVFDTTEPDATIAEICKWINGQPYVFSSLGVAAFGPLCLDKSKAAYGTVTSTPKEAWK